MNPYTHGEFAAEVPLQHGLDVTQRASTTELCRHRSNNTSAQRARTRKLARSPPASAAH